MTKKLTNALIVLRISAVIYYILGILFLLGTLTAKTIDSRLIFFVAPILGCGIFIEFIIRDLKKRKLWAWMAGIILLSIYLPSAFLPLGVIGLRGLFSKETREVFK